MTKNIDAEMAELDALIAKSSHWDKVNADQFIGEMRGYWDASKSQTMRFDIKTVSEANQREHWAAKSTRKKKQQLAFKMLWLNHAPKVSLPATITFTRHSCNTMDADNLAGAFKHVQDQLARQLGVDDGDTERVQWVYKQQRIPKREHYFTVDITEL